MTAETAETGGESVRAYVKEALQNDYRSWREQAGVLDTVHRVVETMLAFGVVYRFVIQLVYYQATIGRRMGERQPVPEDRLRYYLTPSFVVDVPDGVPWGWQDELNARIFCMLFGTLLYIHMSSIGFRAGAPKAALALVVLNGAVLLLDPVVMVADRARTRWSA